MLLVGVGVIVDCLITYATQQAGITLSFGFAVASLVAVWLICNEIISILQQYRDCAAAVPAQTGGQFEIAGEKQGGKRKR